MRSDGVEVGLDELIGLRQRARELAAGVRRRAHEPRGGALHSPFRGRGMEYAESRQYSPGDDVRHVDWRVTARTGQLHSKLFHAERERISAVVYDGSASMAFGTRGCFKRVQAARLAALFAWLALADGDRLAGVGFGKALVDMPVTGGRRGVLRLLDHLVRWQAQADQPPAAPHDALSAALGRLERLLRPGGHLLLLLEPQSLDAAATAVIRRMSRHQDIVACVIVDPLECEPLPPGRYPVTDGLRRSWLDIESAAIGQRLAAHFSTRTGTTLEALRRAGARAHRVRTDADPVLALRDLLRGVVQGEAA